MRCGILAQKRKIESKRSRRNATPAIYYPRFSESLLSNKYLPSYGELRGSSKDIEERLLSRRHEPGLKMQGRIKGTNLSTSESRMTRLKQIETLLLVIKTLLLSVSSSILPSTSQLEFLTSTISRSVPSQKRPQIASYTCRRRNTNFAFTPWFSFLKGCYLVPF